MKFLNTSHTVLIVKKQIFQGGYLFSLKVSMVLWHPEYITIGLLTTIINCNWPILGVPETASVSMVVHSSFSVLDLKSNLSN